MNKLLLSLAICVIATNAHGQVTWEWQAPLPQGNALRAVSFLDAKTGTAVGDRGTILHTTDSGLTWTIQKSGTIDDLLAVCFTDANTGTAVGRWASNTESLSFDTTGHSPILRTTDGGMTWQMQESNTRFALQAVFFTDSKHGTAVGREGTILRTIDGGAIWSRQSVPLYTPAVRLGSVFFSDTNHGTAVGSVDTIGPQEGLILHTSDGGASWSVQSSGIRGMILGVVFSGVAAGAAVAEDGTVLRTTNAGQSWIGTTTILAGYSILSSVYMQDTGHILAIGYGSDGIYHTTDGGATWATLSAGIESGMLMAIGGVGSSVGVAVGSVGCMSRSSDGGLTWALTSKGSSNPWFGVSFADVNNGWVVGRGGAILHTIDRGKSWEPQPGGTLSDLYGVRAIDTRTATVVGAGGVILNTTDGGTNWTRQASGVESLLTGVSFCGANTGMISGGEWILQTTNSGMVWTNSQGSSGSELLGIALVDSLHGTAVGSGGTILHTIDGGASWVSQQSPASALLSQQYPGASWLRGVAFVDSSFGWVVGDLGIILQTTNGGAVWNSQVSGTTLPLHAVSFVDRNIGFVVGGNDSGFAWIGSTTNGGATWIRQASPSSQTLFGVCGLDSNDATAVGWAGTILHTPISGTQSDVIRKFNLAHTSPVTASLFPNPFLQTTTVSFTLSEPSFVRLSVYDVTGREVAREVEGELAGGDHTILFDRGSLPAGVYFYRLATSQSIAGTGAITIE